MDAMESYKNAERLAKEILKMCTEKGITLKELQMLKTALPIAIDQKVEEYMAMGSLNKSENINCGRESCHEKIEKEIAFICTGKAPECSKRLCHKRCLEKEKCSHTTDIEHAANFTKLGDRYVENPNKNTLNITIKSDGGDFGDAEKLIEEKVIPIREKHPFAQINVEIRI